MISQEVISENAGLVTFQLGLQFLHTTGPAVLLHSKLSLNTAHEHGLVLVQNKVYHLSGKGLII